MPLKVVRRKSTGALTISGTLTLSNGEKVRIQQRAQSDDPGLSAEEAKNLEIQILRDDWYGERPRGQRFAAAVLAYFKAHPEATDATKKRYNKILRAVGDPPVSTIGQDTVTKLLDDGFLMASRYRQAVKRAERLDLPLPERPIPRPGTITREIINPLRAACAMVGITPDFVIPAEYEGRTVYFMPDEAEWVISEASAHLKPLLIFLGCTGARLGEALKIRWNDRPAPIDLVGRRALLFSDQTKGKKQRVVELAPRVVEALTNPRAAQQAKRTEMEEAAAKRGARLPPDSGAVFQTPDGEPYVAEGGSPIKTAHAAAVRRAGLDPKVFTPHIWRHTWATYHYALHKDPLKLMVDGGWSDLKLVTRYAHLMPAGHESAILRFLGWRDGPVTSIGPHAATAR